MGTRTPKGDRRDLGGGAFRTLNHNETNRVFRILNRVNDVTVDRLFWTQMRPKETGSLPGHWTFGEGDAGLRAFGWTVAFWIPLEWLME